MLKRLYFSLRYGAYLRSEHGIKKFAEASMGQLILKVTKKSAFFREMNENMLVEKANLRVRQDELTAQSLLGPGEFFSVRRRVWAGSMLLTGVIGASFFLYHISVMAFVGPETGLSSFIRWLLSAILALVLTGGGLIVVERLLESLIPIGPEDEDAAVRRRAKGILWAFLLIGIELSILGIISVRAAEFGSVSDNRLLYYGFVALSLFLPLIAGTIRWDSMQYVDKYKTTRAHRQIDSRLAQIDSILRQNEEYESNFYKMRSIVCWDQLNDFKTYKDIYNERNGIVESLVGHFAQSYDTFQAEAQKRYESDIRDITVKSMRKLDSKDIRPAGSKLGQASRLHNLGNSSGAGTERPESDIYLSPKPIR